MTPPQPPSQTLRELATRWKRYAIAADGTVFRDGCYALRECARELEAALTAQEASPQPDLARDQVERAKEIAAAFKAGYHCHWTGTEYVFDPGFKPGDPNGAFAAYLAACRQEQP